MPDGPTDTGVSFDKMLLRLLICGSVDDGKSTLVGRLVAAGNLIKEEPEEERQRRVMGDIARCHLATARRTLGIAACEPNVRALATAASTAALAVLLVDARKGVLPQTRLQSRICSLFGIRHIVLAVNKLDLAGFERAAFERIAAGYSRFAADLGFATVTAIPLSARYGDNVAERSARMPWYQGPSLLDHLDGIEAAEAAGDQPFRFPVQSVDRADGDVRGLSGTVASGAVTPGDPVLVTGSARSSRVKEILGAGGKLPRAEAGDSVTVTLEDEIEVAPGDLLVPPQAPAEFADQFAAHLVWLKEEPLVPGRAYRLEIGTRTVSATVTALKHRIDVDSGAHVATRTLAFDEIGACNLAASVPVAFDPYTKSRTTGGFALIDRLTQETAAAGVIDFALRRATNVHWHQSTISPGQRAELKGHQPAVLWLTGLSGAGKSTIANFLEAQLLAIGCHTMLLDGDNVRHRLNRDLGFTDTDRVENIRRIAEVARLMGDAGLIVICAFISPFRADRQMARESAAPHRFFEIFVDTPIDECMRRDPKGLYAKASAGAIPNFTGIDSPYEPPLDPDVRLTTVDHAPVMLAAQLVEELRRRAVLA